MGALITADRCEKSTAMGEESPRHIAILPTPGMGHLIPLVELSRKLLDIYKDLTITFIINSDTLEAQRSLVGSLPRVSSVSIYAEGAGDDQPEDESLEAKIVVGVIRSVPSLRRVLVDLLESNPKSVLVVDAFGSFTLGVAKELRIPAYVFFTSAATTLSLSFYFVEHSESYDYDFRDLPGPVMIPGFIPVEYSELPDSIWDRSTRTCELMLEMIQKYMLADGILVNSFFELEPDPFNALHGTRFGNIPPVYGVGPLIRSGSTGIGDAEARCLKWLDDQPPNSVLFVSFGSGGTLSSPQLTELALGLEASQQRFLLVARKPNDSDKSAAYFQSKNVNDHLGYLPNGFIERTKNRGFVVRDWAPQIEILGHPSVGGFLTHCGWNSTLESIVHGVPLIAWPLFAEQRTNAVMLSEVLKVAVRVKENESGIVESEQIERLARRLMEGEEGRVLRERMTSLKIASTTTLSENGSSTKALMSLAKEWNIK